MCAVYSDFCGHTSILFNINICETSIGNLELIVLILKLFWHVNDFIFYFMTLLKNNFRNDLICLLFEWLLNVCALDPLLYESLLRQC